MQLIRPDGNGTGGYKYNLMPLPPKVRQYKSQTVKQTDIDSAVFIGYSRSADFDYYTHYL
jgi:hypothetical protein